MNLRLYKTLKGTPIMLMECYPNGQAKGNVEFNDKGIINGKAKYYYSDGRIKTTGYWENGNKVKEWKEFKSNGRLDLTTTYKKSENE